ncbi:transposase [Streptomyces violarus]|nr:transposase [Streptomyces violarus]MCT9143018.1 transposase [Streptomyces violarus]
MSRWQSSEITGTRPAGEAGRVVKRHIVTDTLGPLLVVAVTAANIGDRDAAAGLLRRPRRLHRDITLVWADGGYTGSLVGWAPRVGTEEGVVDDYPSNSLLQRALMARGQLGERPGQAPVADGEQRGSATVDAGRGGLFAGQVLDRLAQCALQRVVRVQVCSRVPVAS